MTNNQTRHLVALAEMRRLLTEAQALAELHANGRSTRAIRRCLEKHIDPFIEKVKENYSNTEEQQRKLFDSREAGGAA